MSQLSVSAIAEKVKSGALKARDLAEEALAKVEANKEFNAVLRTNEKALAAAEAVDKRAANGEPIGPLAGVPYLAKDNYLTKGLETTAASNILRGYVPPYSATSIEKLEAAGAVLIGKANLDAFAHGSSTENSDYGPTLNPHDKTRAPGGSSGGSAAAVALGITPFALGTDTGGSIRQPASFCGVVGYKPSYGLISRYGVIAMASSTDVIGPLTNTVEDTETVVNILKGQDWRDSTTIKSKDTSASGLKGLKVGVIKEHFGEGIEKSVADAVQNKVDTLKSAGAEIVEISLPSAKTALAVYYVVVSAEVSSNLSRYDGLRYGPRESGKDLKEIYEKTRSVGFNAENKRRIMIGTYVLSSGYYDAYYKKAQQVRTLLAEEYKKALSKVDVLVGPTAPSTAFKLGEKADPVSMYMSDVLTVGPSLVGLPAISLPVGKDEAGLPVGMQITGQMAEDSKLLGIARLVEAL